MKATDNILFKLEGLKNLMCLKTICNRDSPFPCKKVDIYAVISWKIEEVKRNPLIGKSYTEKILKEIYVKESIHCGTNFYGVFNSDLGYIIDCMENDRIKFLQFKDSLTKMSFEINKIETNETVNLS